MQETVASPSVFSTLSTLLLLVFACIGAAQAHVVIAPSPPRWVSPILSMPNRPLRCRTSNLTRFDNSPTRPLTTSTQPRSTTRRPQAAAKVSDVEDRQASP
jgi:hypothetical protein